jgi:hypothetical protein
VSDEPVGKEHSPLESVADEAARQDQRREESESERRRRKMLYDGGMVAEFKPPEYQPPPLLRSSPRSQGMLSQPQGSTVGDRLRKQEVEDFLKAALRDAWPGGSNTK